MNKINDCNSQVKLRFVNKASNNRCDSEALIEEINQHLNCLSLDNIDISTYKSILVTISNSYSLITKEKLVQIYNYNIQ